MADDDTPIATTAPARDRNSLVTATSPSQVYRAGVETGRWQADPAQEAVLASLDRVFHAVRNHGRTGLWSRLRRRRPDAPQGLYLWGGVGRGKTFLVDLLAEQLPADQVHRRHFHRFMREVHDRLRALRGQRRRDPLHVVASDLAKRGRLLCLDEFVVLDIGDAMILSGLLSALFAHGVALATTSNTPPGELYRHGLQRARFLPAITLIERHCEIVELTSATDYRLRNLTRAPVYLVATGGAGDAQLRLRFEQLAPGEFELDTTIEIEGRSIAARGLADGVAWFDFAQLCEGPRAAADYIELARSFNTLLVGNLPQFGLTNRDDAAQRFIHMVDEFYDRRVKLLISAEVPAPDLYRAGRLRSQFERTESRLIEMQSREFLAMEHRP